MPDISFVATMSKIPEGALAVAVVPVPDWDIAEVWDVDVGLTDVALAVVAEPLPAAVSAARLARNCCRSCHCWPLPPETELIDDMKLHPDCLNNPYKQ